MKIPTATYRLQFHAEFTFRDARAILDYLHRLGISDMYASPIFQAVQGSTHGYDVADPNRFNPELGGRDDFDALSRERQRFGLGWLQDIVPNHTAFSPENAMLMDVLEKREDSVFYRFFDIDWDDPDPSLKGKVLIPILGSPLDEVLDAGELTLTTQDGRPMLCYYDHCFPLNAASARQFDSMSDADLAQYPQGAEGKARMKALLDKQYYVMDFWKNANERINYRRFFYINDLISMRVEDEAVMDATHRLIIEQVRRGHFTGLRIDHIDGLYDPGHYLERLREACPEAYIVAEKILEHDEPLCEKWPIEGTTGYDFGAQVNALFCNRDNRSAFLEGYQTFIGQDIDYERLLYDNKRLILKKYMAADLRRLMRCVRRLLDTTADDDRLEAAMSAFVASFPVYRSYFDGREFGAFDRRCIRQAIQTAVRFEPKLTRQIQTLTTLLPLSGEASKPIDAATAAFVGRLQQLTGPVMAKGFEDTLLYIFYPLASLNEVGGAPVMFGLSEAEFYGFIQNRQTRWPHAMNATATHDTKRGEDVRARLNVLSEMPDAWFEKVNQWSRINEHCKTRHEGQLIPDRNDEYLIYQTLLGAKPFEEGLSAAFLERVKAYTVKALRESQRHTTWVEPNEAYEQAATAFIDRIAAENTDFIASFEPFCKRIAEYGIINSLSQTLLKMTAPGVCDFYQGSELWELSLVDPDNRRPVDYAQRSAMLDTLIRDSRHSRTALLNNLIETRTRGGIKMFLIHTILQQRKAFPELFLQGAFVPLQIQGRRRQHILAFARCFADRCAVTVVPRFVSTLAEPDVLPLGDAVWGDTRICLPNDFPTRWNNPVTDESVAAKDSLSVGQILNTFPVAFLTAS